MFTYEDDKYGRNRKWINYMDFDFHLLYFGESETLLKLHNKFITKFSKRPTNEEIENAIREYLDYNIESLLTSTHFGKPAEYNSG